VGNAEFRQGEPFEAEVPEQSVEYWRRSCEAYRAALAVKRSHAGARHNLELVQRRLANLTRRLGNDLRARSEQEFLDEAITSLQAATAYLREAVELVPGDEAIRRDAVEAARGLQQRLLERAGRAETRGDEAMGRNNAYDNVQAERAYRDALADLVGTRSVPPVPGSPSGGEGDASQELSRQAQGSEDRVEAKLSELLSRMGREHQREGEATARYDVDEALQAYDQALERFREAQQLNPANPEARRGEQEVLAAVEALRLSEGRRNLQQGIVSANEGRVVAAAGELAAARDQFEAVLEQNPRNVEAREGAAEARRRLPEVLSRLGRIQQRAGEREEAESAAAAVPHYQEAEMSYRDALELAPEHRPAQQGLAEVESKLASLRRQLTQDSQSASAQPPTQPGTSRDLQSMLGQVENPQRERERELERQRQAARNQPHARKVYPDW
jgi:tetratricopeptide (TPR) repeat protein